MQGFPRRRGGILWALLTAGLVAPSFAVDPVPQVRSVAPTSRARDAKAEFLDQLAGQAARYREGLSHRRDWFDRLASQTSRKNAKSVVRQMHNNLSAIEELLSNASPRRPSGGMGEATVTLTPLRPEVMLERARHAGERETLPPDHRTRKDGCPDLVRGHVTTPSEYQEIFIPGINAGEKWSAKFTPWFSYQPLVCSPMNRDWNHSRLGTFPFSNGHCACPDPDSGNYAHQAIMGICPSGVNWYGNLKNEYVDKIIDFNFQSYSGLLVYTLPPAPCDSEVEWWSLLSFEFPAGVLMDSSEYVFTSVYAITARNYYYPDLTDEGGTQWDLVSEFGESFPLEVHSWFDYQGKSTWGPVRKGQVVKVGVGFVVNQWLQGGSSCFGDCDTAPDPEGVFVAGIPYFCPEKDGQIQIVPGIEYRMRPWRE